MKLILDCYRVEHEARERGIVATEAHLALRQSRRTDAMARLRQWLVENRGQAPPKSTLGKAISYALNSWEALTCFLADAKIPIDNNASERALRIVALGRKKFLFVGNDAAGENIAGLYSLVSSCEAKGVNPEAFRPVLPEKRFHPGAGRKFGIAESRDRWLCGPWSVSFVAAL